MYFATVLMVFFYAMHNLGWLASQLSFTAVFYDNKAINYVFWSLQVEEIAYIFFPLIHRLSETWKYRTGIGLFAAGALSSGLILYGLHVSTLAQWWWLPLSLSSYGLGVLVYLKKIPSLVLPSALIGVFFWGSDAFIAITWVSLPGFAYIVQNADHYKILKSKWLVKIGDISYGIYLIHWLLIDAFGWIGVAIFIPAAWAFEKANVLGLKGLDKLRKK